MPRGKFFKENANGVVSRRRRARGCEAQATSTARPAMLASVSLVSVPIMKNFDIIGFKFFTAFVLVFSTIFVPFFLSIEDYCMEFCFEISTMA
jgi:hypothetical protein